MKKLTLLALLPALLTGGVSAASQFDSFEGKCGNELKQAIKAYAESHTVISYGDKTWDAFKTTDVRIVNGREAWFDMYSNRLVYIADGHSGLNIEHSVANSWWGGKKNDAYKDIYHLNPSDADANGKKSNNPLGVIDGTPSWTNGVTSVGAPTVSTGGGSSTVFEPADEYKGDFARAYFYIFTIYDDIEWENDPAYMYDLSAYPTLKPWAYRMLLDWAADDPVDPRELERANAVEKVQNNVNPFILIPDLAEYVWGSRKTTPWHYSEPVYAPARPEAPTFGNYNVAGFNTWTGRWWDAFSLTLSAGEGSVYYTLTDGDEYQLYTSPIEIGRAAADGQTLVIKAFARSEYNGRDYDSPVATLTLTARNAGEPDYTDAVWKKVTDVSEVGEDGLYIIVAAENKRIMAANAAAKYVNTAGAVDISADDEISLIPEESAVVKFIDAGGSQWFLSVNDVTLKNKGFLCSNEAKSMTIASQGSEATVSVTRNGVAKINFGSAVGNIQYNPQNPRFCTYTSTGQKDVSIFRFVQPGVSTVVNLNEAIPAAASEAVWFDLQGRRVDIDRVAGGIYIRVVATDKGKKAEKVVIRR